MMMDILIGFAIGWTLVALTTLVNRLSDISRHLYQIRCAVVELAALAARTGWGRR